jgi:hypothetical protein
VLSESLFESDGFAWVVAREGISSGCLFRWKSGREGTVGFGVKWWRAVSVISMVCDAFGTMNVEIFSCVVSNLKYFTVFVNYI